MKVCFANGRCAGERDPERITYFRTDLVTKVVVFSEFFRNCTWRPVFNNVLCALAITNFNLNFPCLGDRQVAQFLSLCQCRRETFHGVDGVNQLWRREYQIVCVCVCVYSFRSHPACKAHLFYAALYCHVWPVWLCHVFPHYLMKGAIYHKVCVFWLCLQFLSETFLIVKNISVRYHQCKPVFM